MDNGGKFVIAASIAMMAFSFYKAFFSNSPHPNNNSLSSSLTYTQQLNQLSQQLMIKMRQLELGQNPPIDQCKYALSLVFSYTLNNLRIKNEAMKAKRNKIKRQSKIQMQQYLKFLIEGVQQSKNVATESKRKSCQLMRINNEILSRHSVQLASFKEELRNQGITNVSVGYKLNLKQSKQILQILIQYYKNNGARLVQMISDSVVLWPDKNKQLLFKVISLVVIDQSLTDKYSTVDQMQIQIAKKTYKNQLQKQIDELSEEQKKFYQNFELKIYHQQ